MMMLMLMMLWRSAALPLQMMMLMMLGALPHEFACRQETRGTSAHHGRHLRDHIV